ncbi:dihydropteroate synthase [Maridesulfovibrio ferrireducens]|uniref:Dihydropteroate synthase n=1 Tax=Maridesulfovibrio ferrireducens TaxID=246191 RepID=A0A1G9HVY5_9BACT|nr:dihydropteroate synthase [Maridesulfovibrio ferrireducens]SDL17167.1 dihydropteroate synthase [Maridesulfovibrio ferrireducens]
MNRTYTWTIKGGRVLGPAPFFIAGIVNVTPDSFYDGGTNYDPQKAIANGRMLAAQGADILDVGGESTRPFAEPVSVEAELRRVVPVIEELAKDHVVSIDTVKHEVALAAIEAGASIVNDVSAFSSDPALLEIVADKKPGYVLMHSQGSPEKMQLSPQYDDVIEDVLSFFKKSLEKLLKAGLPEKNIVIDPGIGFGKTLEHNLAILKNIDVLMDLGFPVYMGLSNKSLWGKLLGLETHERQNATQAATAILAARGVPIHRVHDVALTFQTLKVVKAITEGS